MDQFKGGDIEKMWKETQKVMIGYECVIVVR